MRLSILTHDPDLKPINNNYPDSKNTFSTPIVPTHTLANAPADIDVLIVPGGMGSRFETDTSPYVEFIRQRFPGLKFIFSVCTGAELLAKAGVLDGKRCTTNKNDFVRISGLASTAKWEKRARWSREYPGETLKETCNEVTTLTIRQMMGKYGRRVGRWQGSTACWHL